MGETLTPTEQSRLRRGPDRAQFDRDFINHVLDEALVCHIAATVNHRPVVLPTIHWRIGNMLYFHGHGKNGVLRAALAGGAICASVTLLDGLVLARSAFHHSVNYRSVVVHGAAKEVTGDEKAQALDALMAKITPDRLDGIRAANEKELKATLVLALPIEEASGKMRSGDPVDDEEDMALPVWAGVIPIREVRGEPVPDSTPKT